MIFEYPTEPHAWTHGPDGYEDYGSYKPWLRDEFTFRCIYCLKREVWDTDGADSFSVDHFEPQSRRRDLACNFANLRYACLECNSNRSDRPIPDPCTTPFGRLLRVTEDGDVEPLPGADESVAARVIAIFGLAHPRRVRLRRHILRVVALYARLPNDPDVRQLYLDVVGYPDELPNLAALRPPGGNTRPNGVHDSHWQRRTEGRLAETY